MQPSPRSLILHRRFLPAADELIRIIAQIFGERRKLFERIVEPGQAHLQPQPRLVRPAAEIPAAGAGVGNRRARLGEEAVEVGQRVRERLAVQGGAELLNSGIEVVDRTVEFGDVAEITVPIKIDSAAVGNTDKKDLQIALRTSQGNIYAVEPIPAQVATLPEGKVSQDQFRQYFQTYTASMTTVVEDAPVADDATLSGSNIFVVGKNGSRTYVSFALPGPQIFVGELNQTGDNIGVSIKGPSQELFPIIEGSARALFSQK